MHPCILPYDPGREYFFREGCYITELSNAEHDPAVSLARARVETGRATSWHALAQTTERYLILEGRGLVEVGDMPPEHVGPGDVVIIPPDCRQRITNTGTADLIFLVVCSPRFAPRNYVQLQAE